MDLNELISIGKRLGLTGDALTQWVDKEQTLETEARAAERDAEREQAERDERAKRENAELEERIRLLRLRVGEAEAALGRRTSPSEVSDRSALMQLCIRDSVPLVVEKRDLDVYASRFEAVTSQEGVVTGQKWPEDNLPTSPCTPIKHTQCIKKGQFEPHKPEKGFSTKNPTSSEREHFCYSASWRTNEVKDEVNLPQNCSPAGAMIAPSNENGASLEENCDAVVADASSAPLLAAAGDTTMARGHVDESLLTAYSSSVSGRGDSNPRKQEERTGVLVRDEKADSAIEPGGCDDVAMQDGLSDGAHSAKEVTGEPAVQLGGGRALSHCSPSKQADASTAASLAAERVPDDILGALLTYRTRQGVGFSKEINCLFPTGPAPSQSLRRRCNNVRVGSSTGLCQAKFVERGHPTSVFLRILQCCCRRKRPLEFPVLSWTCMQSSIRLVWDAITSVKPIKTDCYFGL